ncbi:MAG: ATP-binding cassette domain-containing protein [Clostridia bacterium]|nr:ATP-binding cassette domain-containing protein [Clostridia bacterium]
MIKIEHLTKYYGQKLAVDDISFSVEPGEVVGFLGPNGAGKSTTMNMLTGYLSSTSGKCSIDGIDILENLSEAKRLIGFLPEQPPLYYDMTTREYLSFIYDLKRCTLNRREHIDEIIDIMGLGEMEKRLISQLSKGFKQRVGIAGALVSNPKILIFDEPTIGLDPRQIIEIRDLIRTLGEDHTIILSTHILPEVQAVCGRILIIDRGRLIADQKTDEINTLAEDNRKFTVRIVGAKNEVLNFLRKTEGAAKVEFMSSGKDGSSLYMVQCKKGYDLRKTLFYALAEKRWPIIEMQNVGASLEDIFIAMTK